MCVYVRNKTLLSVITVIQLLVTCKW